MPKRNCLVLIPHPQGGHNDYEVTAESSMEAVRIALRMHENAVPPDAVITIILDGKKLSLWGCHEHNAKQPAYRHRAGVVIPL